MYLIYVEMVYITLLLHLALPLHITSVAECVPRGFVSGGEGGLQ